MDWKDIKKLNKRKLMSMVGRDQSAMPDWLFPALGFFGAGLVIGAGLGLMLAPKSGQELRDDLKSRLGDGAAPEALAANAGSRSSTPSR